MSFAHLSFMILSLSICMSSLVLRILLDIYSDLSGGLTHASWVKEQTDRWADGWKEMKEGKTYLGQ